jgi:HEAT repeat protein
MRIINCPSCQRRLQLPEDGLERSLQCPACHAVFEARANAPSSLGVTGLEVSQEGGFRTGKVQHVPLDNERRRRDVEEDTPHSFSLVLQKRPEGIIRRTLGIVGFVSGIVVGLVAFAASALDWRPGLWESLGVFVLALVFSPIIGIVLAAIGVGFGGWVEVVIRLFKRRPGESVLLTLVGDKEAGAPAVASSFPWDKANDLVTHSDCGDSTSQPSQADPDSWKKSASPPTTSAEPFASVADPPRERDRVKLEPEPVLVRGDVWKNTAADPRGSLPQPEIQPASELSYLIQRLRHKEPTVRMPTAEVLGQLGPKAREAIPAILLAACDIDAGVRKAAAAALDQVDSGWPTHPGATAAVPALIKEMGRRLSDISQAASLLLSRIGRSAVPELAQALTDTASDIHQVFVAQTLRRIGPHAAAAVPALAQALTSEFAHVRQAAVEALAQVGPAAEAATPALVVALADWHSKVRHAAARCLARIGGASELAIPGLIQLLPDREDEVRGAAVEALAQIGSAAVPSLIEMAQARDFHRMQEWLKWRVEFSDWYTRPINEDFQREPLKALQNARWYFRHAVEDHVRVEMVHEAALRALGKIGPDACAAVPVLDQALADPNPKVRLAAIWALGQIGPHASAVIPTLMQRLVDKSKPVRQAAADALGQIDPNWASSTPVRETLVALAESLKRSGEEGQVAVDAFAVIGSAAVPVLVEALASDDRILRETAATALGRIGPGAQAAIPALVKASQDSHGWVREAAAQALQKVGPQGFRVQGEQASAPGM